MGAIVGTSGAGKSTLTNALLGREAQRTAPVRGSDDRGVHTTSGRELFPLPGGRQSGARAARRERWKAVSKELRRLSRERRR